MKNTILAICNQCANEQMVEEIGGLDNCAKCGSNDIGYQDKFNCEACNAEIKAGKLCKACKAKIEAGDLTRCEDCGEYIDLSANDAEYFIGRNGEKYCAGCYENEWSYPMSAIKFNPDGEIEDLQFTKNFAPVDAEDPEPVERIEWVSSGGYRGYYNFILKAGYKELADGWITGWPDETTQRKAELSDYFEKLRNGELCPPVELWWLFAPTSNIFSTASTIVCRAGDQQAIEDWLKEIDGGLEHFQEMLD